MYHPSQNNRAKRKLPAPYGRPTGLICWDDFEVHKRWDFLHFRWVYWLDYVICGATDVRNKYGEEWCTSTTWREKTYKCKSLREAAKIRRKCLEQRKLI